MNVAIVIADLPVVDNLRVVGGTDQLVVLEAEGKRFACDRATGAQAAVPDAFVARVEPGRIDVDGTELALRVRPPAVMRRGRVALALAPRAQAALVPGVGAFAIEHGTSPMGAPALVPVAIPRAGKLVALQTLPVWTVNHASSYDLDPAIEWTVCSEPTARVVVIATHRRASWLTFETIAELAAMPETRHAPQVTVVVARRPTLDWARLDTFDLDRSVRHRDVAGELAASALTPAVTSRMTKLRELGVAPGLDDDRIEELAGALAIAHQLGDDPANACGTILGAFLETVTGSDHLVGPGCVMRAAVANATRARDAKRFVAFSRYLRAPIFIAVDASTRKQLESILHLGPEPPPVPTGLAVALVELAKLAPASFEVTLDGERTHVTLHHDAVIALDEALA